MAKRDISDQACLVVSDLVDKHGSAPITTVTDARQKLLDYGQPALANLCEATRPRGSRKRFHLFLLSLYDSLAQAANPPAGAGIEARPLTHRLTPRSCLRAEQPGDDRLEVPARQVDLDNRPVAADQDIGRDIRDSVGFGVVAIARAVDQRGPGDVVIEQEPADIGQDGFQFLAAVLLDIEVDTDDLQASVVIGVLDLLEPGDLGGIGQAPACPEDDQDDFPFFTGEVERLAVEVRSLDGRSRLAHQLDPFQTACEEVLDGGTIGLCRGRAGKPHGRSGTGSPSTRR